MCLITAAATSTRVALSIPCNPGDEFTSMTAGPRAVMMRSTPAKASSWTSASRTANYFIPASNWMERARPPR